MMRYLYILMLVFFGTGVFAQTEIQGHVHDSSGAPIVGAQISIKESTATTTTDSDGHFSFWSDLEGNHILQVNHLDFAAEELTIQLTGRKVTNAFVLLEEGIGLISNTEDTDLIGPSPIRQRSPFYFMDSPIVIYVFGFFALILILVLAKKTKSTSKTLLATAIIVLIFIGVLNEDFLTIVSVVAPLILIITLALALVLKKKKSQKVLLVIGVCAIIVTLLGNGIKASDTTSIGLLFLASAPVLVFISLILAIAKIKGAKKMLIATGICLLIGSGFCGMG